MSNIRIVAPFFPLPAEHEHHKALSDFDWITAIRMLFDSARRACGACPIHVITDVSADLPLPTLRYETQHRRLMLWYLEAAVCYLASDDFDRDTVMLDSDQLIYGDLSKWFEPDVDLGILARDLPPKDPTGFRILNGVQFWSHRGKARLAAFYRQALALAQTFSEDTIAWGADTRVLEQLLEPLDVGATVDRAGVRVHMIPAEDVLERVTKRQLHQMRAGGRIELTRDVSCFRNMRKLHMKDFYRATLGEMAVMA
ncbi:MAG: hypothetical protein ABI665_03875 [Vicinamibacterales bacterium]